MRTLVATLVRIVVLLLVAAPFAAQAQLPTFRVWPDTLPPCDTTLQACINGSGETTPSTWRRTARSTRR